MYRIPVSLLFLVALLSTVVLPASAVLQEVTVKGTVSSVSADKNTLTLANPSIYGCVYSGTPVCSYTPMNVSSLSGTIPDQAAFSVFRVGDPAVATSIGGAGETWIAIAKLSGPGSDQEYVTDIVGDAGAIPTPLAGNYSLDLATTPDCQKCAGGSTCIAAASTVAIRSEGRIVANRTLNPQESLFFNARNDGSSINVTFVAGQAFSDTCPQAQKGLIGGIQPVSDYLVHVVPPIGMTVAPQKKESSEAPVVDVSRNAPSSSPTRKSGTLPLAATGALGSGAVFVALRKP